MDRVMEALRAGWPPKVTDNIRVVKVKKDGSGAVFDLWDDKVELFMDYYNDVKARNPDSQVEVKKCTQLPELEEEDDDGGFGGGWRGGISGGPGFGGGNRY